MLIHASTDGCTKRKEKDIFDLLKLRPEIYRREFTVYGDVGVRKLEHDSLLLDKLNEDGE
jgi:hypothetical protein